MADSHSPGPFLDHLVRGDAEARSWREKLALVRDLIVDHGNGGLSDAALADLAIYLRFLSTGEVACVEDGRHFRPSHHARMATEIHARLADLESAENAFVVRKIQACLPSTAAPFQRPEPLTRIRDIAHRNDIPQELKREIKTTLQNKLHRCAGPEDLLTSAGLLERITAPDAHYSGDFVEQFRIFHGELSEFFNARSLEERLEALAATAEAGSDTTTSIAGFLDSKRDDEASPGTLRTLTDLRRKLTDPRHDNVEFRLADIALEDFAFPLLSRTLNRPDLGWDEQIDLLALLLANLGLSGIAPDEVQAMENELAHLRERFSPEERDALLRLKASVERARRLSGEFSDAVLLEFAARATSLGEALGVEAHAIRVFAEGEIRSHLVFQLAKLASTLLERIRHQLGLEPWDVLVTGEAVGRVTTLASLDDQDRGSEPLIAVLDEASGDEEIPAGVVAVILGHELPHLSHLGVRARQAGVIVASCGEPGLLDEIKSFAGDWVSLRATPERIVIESAATSGESTPSTDRSEVRQIPEIALQPDAAVIPVEQARPETGGNKSDGARRLLDLAARPESGFSAPPGLVIPFGVMEQSLAATPELQAEYASLQQRIDGLPADEFTAAVARLREIVARVPVPDGIPAAVADAFGPDRHLAVRSSANSEDLPDLAGAGLHESVAGISAREVDAAVRRVWASLWTGRAAASRRQAGIAHDAAHMAVLIQPLAEAELSFILHSVDPLLLDPDRCYIEVAVGLGETLASAAVRGTPFRLRADKRSGRTELLAFASFSHSLEAGPEGELIQRSVDYSQVPFAIDPDRRADLGARLARIAAQAEEAFGAPQDIEGVIVGNDIVLVQSRDQQGIPKPQSS